MSKHRYYVTTGSKLPCKNLTIPPTLEKVDISEAMTHYESTPFNAKPMEWYKLGLSALITREDN